MRFVKEHKFIAVCIAAAVICCALVLMALMSGTGKDQEEHTDSIVQTIYDRALQCYVIEGAYPESLSYLEENYGLAINKKDYTVVYTPYAENLPPDIKVIYKRKDRS